jgi:hypothetical protein
VWPFKRKRYRVVNQIIDVPMPILIRQVVYDSIFNYSYEISNKMGLPPISEEVHDMEERASQERISKFSALLPFIDAHADIAAKVAAMAYVIESDNPIEFEDSTNFAELTKLFKLVSLSSSVSCISTLMNLGLLETKVVSNDDE